MTTRLDNNPSTGAGLLVILATETETMCDTVTIGDQDYESVGELQAVLGVDLVSHAKDGRLDPPANCLCGVNVPASAAAAGYQCLRNPFGYQLWKPKPVPARGDLAIRLIDGLREFADKLKSGEPIEATRVTVEHTPDGPLTTRKKVLLRPREGTDGE